MRLVYAIGMAAVVSMPPVVANRTGVMQSPSAGDAITAPSTPKTPPTNPYGQLFVPPASLESMAERFRNGQSIEQHRPSVVCGITIIPVDPRIDPGIVRQPPQAESYSTRVLKPSVCGR